MHEFGSALENMKVEGLCVIKSSCGHSRKASKGASELNVLQMHEELIKEDPLLKPQLQRPSSQLRIQKAPLIIQPKAQKQNYQPPPCAIPPKRPFFSQITSSENRASANANKKEEDKKEEECKCPRSRPSCNSLRKGHSVSYKGSCGAIA